MSLNGCLWLSAASIGSHQRQASDSQCFAHYGVNGLLTRHLEAHFHLNVTVVYLTTEYWGSNSPPPPPQTGPGCHRRRRADQERSVWNSDSPLEAATSVQPTLWRFAAGNNLLLMGLDFLLWPCVYNAACVQCKTQGHESGSFPRGESCVPEPCSRCPSSLAVFPSPLEFH